MSEEVSAPELKADAQFSPSWIDRLIRWIDRLPGPAWLVYVFGIAATAVLINVALWIDGSVPFGELGTIRGIFPPLVFYFLAVYHYLSQVASDSLRTFRPLLDLSESGIAKISHELRNLPRPLGWLAVLLGLAVIPPYLSSDQLAYGDLVPKTALPIVLAVVLAGFAGATFMSVVIRGFRQLRRVHSLHEQAMNINLLKLGPAQTFSALTARTGISVFLIILFGWIYSPSSISSDRIAFVYVAIALVSAAIFAIPVIGLRGRLEEEKRRALDETSDMLQVTRDRLHDQVRSDNYHGMSETKDAIEALIRERELFDRISTWPWDPGTIRGFASTLLLPIFLWLVTRLLERIL